MWQLAPSVKQIPTPQGEQWHDGRELDRQEAQEQEEEYDEASSLALEKEWGMLRASDVLEKYGIPYTNYFLRTQENLNSPGLLLLPLEVSEKAPAGVIVALDGELYVVVTDALVDRWFMCLAPARYIDITR